MAGGAHPDLCRAAFGWVVVSREGRSTPLGAVARGRGSVIRFARRAGFGRPRPAQALRTWRGGFLELEQRSANKRTRR